MFIKWNSKKYDKMLSKYISGFDQLNWLRSFNERFINSSLYRFSSKNKYAEWRIQESQIAKSQFIFQHISFNILTH